MQFCKIPEERLEKLNLKKIKDYLGCDIEIKDGQIIISSPDSFKEYIGRNVITAYGRGFSLEDSLDLLDENKYLKIIELKDYVNNKKQLTRVRGRVIGKKGKVKKEIERITGAKIAIYGKTIAIIGTNEEIAKVEIAVNKILLGGKQITVLRLLQQGKI